MEEMPSLHLTRRANSRINQKKCSFFLLIKYPVPLGSILATMKNQVIIHILLFVLLMLVYQCAGAQDYVLTAKGDSLTGEVKPLLYGPEKRVQIHSEDNQKTSLSLFQVRAFSSNGEIYHPVKGDNGYVFMKLIQTGYLSLYAYQLENQTRFDGLFLRKNDGESMSVPNLGFKKYLGQFLDDCPDVAAKIKDGELGKRDLDKIVTAYNSCVNSRTVDHDKIMAEHDERTTKINAWEALEEKIGEREFGEKTNALEMITEIRKKIERRESIPNFLVEGLKNSLKNTGLDADLEQALSQIN